MALHINLPIYAGGIKFEFGEHSTQEYYHHRDARGWEWGVFRHKVGPWQAEWIAYVSQPGPETPCAVLNTCLLYEEGGPVKHHGPLYFADARTPAALLAALAPLVKAGEWPETIIYPKRHTLPRRAA